MDFSILLTIFILIAMNCMIEMQCNSIESLESNDSESKDGFCPETDYGPHSPSVPCDHLYAFVSKLFEN